MGKFKTLFITVVACMLLYAGLSWYYNGKIEDKDRALREEREAHAEVIVTYNEKIGNYTTTIGRQENDLQDAHSLLEQQKDTIRELNKDLNARVEVINALTLQVDSLQSAGVAEFIIINEDTLKYTIKEHKQGILLDFELTHPTGNYNYTVTYDPLEMELYLSKEKDSEIKVGSIVFPNNPYIKVTDWDIFYDPDTRPWYNRVWDDVRFETGIFAGPVFGVIGMIGYRELMAGPVMTEDGMSLGIMYRIK